MAPEVANNDHRPHPPLDNSHYDGTQADVWSIGICLFILATGYMPFLYPCKEDMMYYYIDKREWIKFWDHSVVEEEMSDTVRTAIHHILVTDPAKRPTAQDLVQEYDHIIHDWSIAKAVSKELKMRIRGRSPPNQSRECGYHDM
jgi:serine/threonine protein kinase